MASRRRPVISFFRPPGDPAGPEVTIRMGDLRQRLHAGGFPHARTVLARSCYKADTTTRNVPAVQKLLR